MRLRLIQWNVWQKENPERIAAYLADVDADILCLQELTTTSPQNPGVDIPELLAERLGFYKAYVEAQRWVVDGHHEVRAQGNAILSRYPIVNSKHVYVQDSKGFEPPYDGEGRIYLEAVVDLGPCRLRVATAHLSYVKAFGAAPHQELEVRRLIHAIGRPRGRYVFAGDLNMLSEAHGVQELPAKTGLVPVGPDYGQATWSTKRFKGSAGGEPETGLLWRLDYAFATSDVRVVRAELGQTDVSDHLPIVAELEVE